MRTIDEIYQEMLACFGEQTGLEPREGCDLSARLYALAAQVYSLYVQADWVVRQAFPQTAEGEYLDRHAQLRGLERKPAVAAEGIVRFTAGDVSDAAREIPQGTVCMTAGLIRFETTKSAEIPANGWTADVPVRALEPGSSGNVSAKTIVSMAVAPIGIFSCTNLEPCAGGADGEADEGLRERVLETFKRLPNGANCAFYQQGALSFDQVAAATVIPRPYGRGTVAVIPATLAGQPKKELLDEMKAYFDQRREIAVDLEVRAPKPVTVNITVQVELEEGRRKDEVLSRVEESIRGWFTGRLLGQRVLRAKLGEIVYHCEGVANYSVTAPTADVEIKVDELPVLGTLKVEVKA